MNPEKVLEAPISHEMEPHCCGCWIVWRTDTKLYAKCNECGEERDILGFLARSATERTAAPPGVTVSVSYDSGTWMDAKIVGGDFPFGLGIVEVEGTAGRYLPFRFDKIDGYRGESPKSAGIRVGAMVSIFVRDEKIERLRVVDGMASKS